MRDYRIHLQAVLKRRPATVNNALAAIDHLYIRRHLGAASAARLELPATAPRALSRRDQLRYLRAVQGSPSPRDQALALTPFYAGARISEIVGLDVDDVRLSARKGTLRIYGKGERVRDIPIHHSYAPRSPAGSTNAPDDPVLRSLRPSFSTSAAGGS